jgi:hypothetical protein
MFEDGYVRAAAVGAMAWAAAATLSVPLDATLQRAATPSLRWAALKEALRDSAGHSRAPRCAVTCAWFHAISGHGSDRWNDVSHMETRAPRAFVAGVGAGVCSFSLTWRRMAPVLSGNASCSSAVVSASAIGLRAGLCVGTYTAAVELLPRAADCWPARVAAATVATIYAHAAVGFMRGAGAIMARDGVPFLVAWRRVAAVDIAARPIVTSAIALTLFDRLCCESGQPYFTRKYQPISAVQCDR